MPSALPLYVAVNPSQRRIVGSATFNAVPAKAGAYFNKVECFCLTEQALAPGASGNMPTPFFVDPAISDDPNMDDVTTITLSHIFFGVAGGDQDPGWQFDDDYYRQTDAKRVTARWPGRPSGAEGVLGAGRLKCAVAVAAGRWRQDSG